MAQVNTTTAPSRVLNGSAIIGVASEEFKAAMASFAAGVTVVTTIDADGSPHAMTATAFSSVSLNPPLCLVCVNRRARMHRLLIGMGHVAINVLSAGQESLSTHFATPAFDKFAAIAWYPGKVTGCPLIEGALAWMECRVTEVYAGGDHDIFIAHLSFVQVNDGSPLLYWRGKYATLPPRSRAALGRSVA